MFENKDHLIILGAVLLLILFLIIRRKRKTETSNHRYSNYFRIGVLILGVIILALESSKNWNYVNIFLLLAAVITTIYISRELLKTKSDEDQGSNT